MAKFWYSWLTLFAVLGLWKPDAATALVAVTAVAFWAVNLLCKDA
jgi:hypothetical protein